MGLLAVVAIFTFVWGYNFLKGKDVFSSSDYVFVEYDRVDGMTASALVLINGFQVGYVSDLYLKEDGSGKIVAIISLDNGVKIPKNTVAAITSPDLLSGKAITLEFDKACGDDCVMSGDTIQGTVKNMLQSMVGDVPVKEYVEKAKDAINSGIDSILVKFGAGGDGDGMSETFDDLKATISNLRGATAGLNILLANTTDDFTGIASNLNDLTLTLKNNSDQIEAIMQNTADLTEKLKDADINETLENTNSAITELKNTMESADKALGSLEEVMDKLNYGEGTAALLMNDPKLYNNLNNAMRDLDLMLKDFRLNPKRYVNVSVFGKKQKQYEGVADDPEGKEAGSNPNEKSENPIPEGSNN